MKDNRHDEAHNLSPLFQGLSRHGDKPAILALRKNGTERWSYQELADRVASLAQGLQEAGIGKDTQVVLLAENSPVWIMACLGIIQAGAVVVPLDVQLDDEALNRILDDSEPRLIFTDTTRLSQLERIDGEPDIALLDAATDDDRSWQHYCAEPSGEWPPMEPDDPATLFYTSGTTGPPKGVPLSQANLAFQLSTLVEAKLVGEDDRVLLPLPLHHVYPFVIGMLAPLRLGLPIVLPQSRTGPQMVRALREGQVTLIIGVPRLYSALYSGITARAESGGLLARSLFKTGMTLSLWCYRRLGWRLGRLLLRPLHQRFGPRLRVLASGGSALDAGLAQRLEALGWRIAIGYGLTETAPLLTINPPGSARLDSVGRPAPGVDIRIDASAQAENDGNDEQGTGEILARGPNVFAGYRHLPEKTEKAFTEDGWFRTGDLGYLDGDGWLHVEGRVSTLIITESGEKVQPDQVEEAYEKQPFIREIGVLQEQNRLAAVVVPDLEAIRQQGIDAVDEALREAMNQGSKSLPSYQRVADYVISREPLARTRLGKIRRHLLEQHYQDAKTGEEEPTEEGPMPVAEMAAEDRALLEENTAAQRVWDWLAERYTDRRLAPDTHLQFDLGIDSLEWMNLTVEIQQRTGRELAEETIARIDTVRDLLKEVAEGSETAEAPTAPLEKPEETLDAEQRRWLEPLNPAAVALAWLLYWLNRLLMRGLFRLQAQGLEHLPEQSQVVITPNHASYLDPFAVAAALSFQRLRQTYWGGWTGAAFTNPITRSVSRLAQVVPINPERATVSSLAFGAAVLKDGGSLIWFPEGRRAPDGRLQPFKPGIGLLLERFPAPVAPVFIEGSFAALPPGSFLPRLKKIKVVFGRPLDVNDLERQGEGDEPHTRIARALHNQVAELESGPG